METQDYTLISSYPCKWPSGLLREAVVDLQYLAFVNINFPVLKNEDHGIWSHHIMANRWGNNGNSDSKITADGDCSHEIKRCLLLGRKDITNLDSILESKDISLPRKVHLLKTMVFPVITYGCESWTVKKAEQHRIDTF